MEHLSVRNWETYQHYKAAKPKWIKWYREVTNDLGWLGLEESGKLLLPYILLVAAETENEIPNDHDLLALRLRLKPSTVRKGIDSLLISRFLQFMQDDEGNVIDFSPHASARTRSVSVSVSVSGRGESEGGGVEIPDKLRTEAFIGKWTEWLDYRRAHRWTVKIPWQEKQLNMLAEVGATDAIAALEMSMANGWRGVFPKGTKGKRPKQGLISDKFRRDK